VVQDAAVSADASAVEMVYREQGPRLWRALLAYTGDPELANDAMSEAFAQALARGDELRNPAAWIWAASFKIAAGQLKDRSTTAPPAQEVTYVMPESVDGIVEALRQLSPKQRLAVVLHDYADRPNDEVAAILGVSVATVHVHLSQGRRRLRALLEDDRA
jgi:RNA polymerase sigma-70 factor (ECF subfamily)